MVAEALNEPSAGEERGAWSCAQADRRLSGLRHGRGRLPASEATPAVRRRTAAAGAAGPVQRDREIDLAASKLDLRPSFSLEVFTEHSEEICAVLEWFAHTVAVAEAHRKAEGQPTVL
ncbi:hypothetical protein KBZ10_12335 [Streptomyces sp. F63]|uniref:hypothetical protein n=1 Tax=Streptomyces sp. F63 TaxID=2824887 RepID=UPI001B36EBDC|nr:hypothetical protein [Streptomyces sp. F63]MBQ0985291.1 hypothetical protein [Streptomyces sp. F63]